MARPVGAAPGSLSKVAISSGGTGEDFGKDLPRSRGHCADECDVGTQCRLLTNAKWRFWRLVCRWIMGPSWPLISLCAALSRHTERHLAVQLEWTEQGSHKLAGTRRRSIMSLWRAHDVSWLSLQSRRVADGARRPWISWSLWLQHVLAILSW